MQQLVSFVIQIQGVGYSSVVEPRDTQVLRGCGLKLGPTESSCWALMPQVCSDLPRNQKQPGAVYGSLALKALYFLVRKHGDRLAILTFLTIYLIIIDCIAKSK